jgi:phage repressor protein C with HTH and peptisase S24 domain
MVKKSVVVQPEVRFIPLVSTYTCADFLEGRMANLEQLPILGERKGFELAFRLEGNNMAERLNHGAVVICRSVDEKDYEYILTNTQVAYVVVRGSTFGVYYLENQLADHQQFVLHSHNSGPFPPLVAKREQIRGIYRVLAVQQDLD